MNRQKIALALLLVLVPFLSGCSLFADQKQPTRTAVNTNLVKEKYIDNTDKDSQKIALKAEKESVVTSTVTSTKLINNLKKKNSMDKFDPNKQYIAKVSTTVGDFTISFNKGQTPKTVENFVTLASKGFYDKTIFHRVIKGFMIQGGDPLGTGTGGPGYKFDDESFDGEYLRGTVAMANSGPNTNGSQFFIMHADYPLPKNYVIFGHVISGMETVDKIATAQVKSGGFGELSTPVDPVSIKSIEVTEK